MQRDENKVIEEEINSLGPALHSSVASSLSTAAAPQFGIEEGAKRVDLQCCCFVRTPLHDKGQVEVYHLDSEKETGRHWSHIILSTMLDLVISSHSFLIQTDCIANSY